MHKWIVILALLSTACNSTPVGIANREQRPENKTVKTAGFSISAAVFKTADTTSLDEVQFRTVVHLEKAGLEEQPDLGKALQYGADSAFYLTAGRDTVWPRYVLPVANGQALKPEFILAFAKQPLQQSTTIQLHAHIPGMAPGTAGIPFTIQEINSQY